MKWVLFTETIRQPKVHVQWLRYGLIPRALRVASIAVHRSRQYLHAVLVDVADRSPCDAELSREHDLRLPRGDAVDDAAAIRLSQIPRLLTRHTSSTAGGSGRRGPRGSIICEALATKLHFVPLLYAANRRCCN